MDYAWTCSCCGKQFNTLPLDVGFPEPHYWACIPVEEREERGEIDSDVCLVDEHIFIRGCLEIPIIGQDEVFIWGVWASLSKESFDRVVELWDAPVIDDEPPKFGWFNTQIPGYPDTVSLKTHVYLRGGGTRPLIQLEPTDHPLAVEQREGITLARVQEIVEKSIGRH